MPLNLTAPPLRSLKHGVEMMIREEVPEIVDIIDVTDHAAGQNPYSAASKK